MIKSLFRFLKAYYSIYGFIITLLAKVYLAPPVMKPVFVPRADYR